MKMVTVIIIMIKTILTMKTTRTIIAIVTITELGDGNNWSFRQPRCQHRQLTGSGRRGEAWPWFPGILQAAEVCPSWLDEILKEGT